MPKVTFIQQDGEKVVIDDAVGTLMEIATDHEVEGITGDCGGVCSCSTCHVYVAPEWQSKLAAADEMEVDTLDFNDHKRPNSRLGCQAVVERVPEGGAIRVSIPVWNVNLVQEGH